MEELKRIFVHIRWPLQSFTLLGLLFGVVVSKTNLSISLLFGFISWFLLCAGITVFNSYYDKDENPVAGLENPPATTFSMLVGAWSMKIAGIIIAIFLNKVFFIMVITGTIISVLYSHEKFRFKSNGYVAVFVNFIVGIITFIASSSFTHNPPIILVLGSLTAGAFLAGIYLMMQVHQKEEDKLRKDISITVIHGRKVTLISAIVLMVIASILSMATFLIAEMFILIFITIVYFGVILIISYFWLKKQENATSDFNIMNKLTMRLSYAGIFILVIMYIFQKLIK